MDTTELKITALHENMYKKSDIYTLLKSAPKKRIAFLDIDATMTGNPDVTNMTRRLLEKRGFAVVFVTSRTEEMLLSHDSYKQSSTAESFHRPRPHLTYKDGAFSYIPPEEHEPLGLLDPEIIVGSTGTQILVRQQNTQYLLDKTYEKNFEIDSTNWRKKNNAAS